MKTDYTRAQGQNTCLVLKIARKGDSFRNITKFVTLHFQTPSMRTTGNSIIQLDPALLVCLLELMCSSPALSPAGYLVLSEDASPWGCSYSGTSQRSVSTHTAAKGPLPAGLNDAQERTHSSPCSTLQTYCHCLILVDKLTLPWTIPCF